MTAFDEAVAGEFAEFEAFLLRFDALLLTEPRAALAFVDGASDEIKGEGEWVICRADALEAAAGAEAAALFLREFIAEEPEHVDAHHRLAGLYRVLGQHKEATVHYLETLRLDSELDRLSESATSELKLAIVAEVESTLAGLPKPIRERLGSVPILLADRPSADLIRDGLDPRTLGLFEGPNSPELRGSEASPNLTSIAIFVCCLVQTFGLDEGELLEQVRITVLHEVGHFFGLDEAELTAIGLD